MIDNTYALGKILGLGGSSRVFEATDQQGNELALKIIKVSKQADAKKAPSLILQECLTYSKIGSHPNILNISSCNPEGIWVMGDVVGPVSYMTLEKCANGTLARIVRHTGPFEETIAKVIFLQLCHAVHHLHSQGYAHLDIKLENILLDSNF